MSQITRRIIPFETKSADGTDTDGWTFEGLASPYLNIDWCGDVIEPGAFDADLEFTRTEGKVRNEHGNTTGRITDAKSQTAGLFIGGLILPTSDGRDQYILVKGKAITRLSIGYQTLRSRWLEGQEAVRAYWEEKGYNPSDDDLIMLGSCFCVRVIERARVYEVSTTWLPMNDKAEITSVKSADAPTQLTFSDHSDRTLAAVAEFLGRAESVKSLRTADGRELGAKTRGTLVQLKSRLDALLVATEPPANTDDEAEALYNEWLAMESRLTAAGI